MFMPTVSENGDSKEAKEKVMKEVDFITLAYVFRGLSNIPTNLCMALYCIVFTLQY